ncbi:hypothetical protein GGR28_002275 [Lewinella aquimaris]|uniref:Adhesin domain-containing protein n=1 Tax=Neolewinella aquimaris TaxID=1835722 RepID=A0A840E3J2_9BACT|nr:hypothetical protein [Neolewinella aquimaris]MBB4079650.1 hypothetical protein [Neolewinella aquimaris]
MLRILFLLCLTSALGAQQDFKIAAGGKTIEFKEIDRLTIVGSTGTEMTLEAQKEGKVDDRAAGLRQISASGLTDNTGFGLSVTEREGRILVQQVGGEGSGVTVRVPNSATVSVEQTTHRGGDLKVSDFSGELDVSMMYHHVELNNVTGPVAVNAVYDDIIAKWDAAPTKEVRLHSTYADVDVTLPASTKADLRLSTGYGNMYTDFDIQIKSNTVSGKPETERDEWRGRRDRDDIVTNSLSGTINGGGTLLALTATYDNLYIRKK